MFADKIFVPLEKHFGELPQYSVCHTKNNNDSANIVPEVLLSVRGWF